MVSSVHNFEWSQPSLNMDYLYSERGKEGLDSRFNRIETYILFQEVGEWCSSLLTSSINYF